MNVFIEQLMVIMMSGLQGMLSNDVVNRNYLLQ